jgi:propanol-preferring alcohol dehydrogenase
MKCMLLYKSAPIETSPLRYMDIENPRISSKEVLIRVSACGVCHSNLHMIEGDWLDMGVPAKSPIVPGHEVTGTIEEVGAEVKDSHVGDKVGVQPLYDTCGTCEPCLTGRENVCDKAQITGETVDGGYAQLMKAVGTHVYELPGNLDPVSAAPLFCPGLTAYKAVTKVQPFPGKSVAIFGIGGVGHMAIQFAKLSGARVIGVSRSSDHLKLAKEVGADVTLSSEDRDFASAVGPVDSSIVFAPSDDYINMAVKSTKKGGRVIIGVRGNIHNFPFNREIVIKGTAIGTRIDMQNVLKIASQGLVRVKINVYNLSDANKVLLGLKKAQIQGRAVLVP